MSTEVYLSTSSHVKRGWEWSNKSESGVFKTTVHVCVTVPVCLTPGCQDEKGEIAVIMASHVQQKHQREVICWTIFNQWR